MSAIEGMYDIVLYDSVGEPSSCRVSDKMIEHFRICQPIFLSDMRVAEANPSMLHALRTSTPSSVEAWYLVNMKQTVVVGEVADRLRACGW